MYSSVLRATLHWLLLYHFWVVELSIVMTESKPISTQTQQTYPSSIDVAIASVQATS